MTIDQHRFRRAVGRFATGVTVVTTGTATECEAMTANAFTSVSLDPVLVLVSVRNTARWRQAVDSAGAFVVNVLSAAHEDISRWCADPARHEHPDPYAHLRTSASPVTGLLRLDDALATLDCRTYAIHPAGDHDLVVGEVVALDLRPEPEQPLVFFDGGYHTVSPADAGSRLTVSA